MRIARNTKTKIFVSLLVVVMALTLLISFSYARIWPGSPFFNLTQAGFGPGQVIDGNLNFSLSDEPGNAIIRAVISPGNIIKNMSLYEFLKKANIPFNCTPIDCNLTYSTTSGEPTKTFAMSTGTEAYYGFVASGNNVQIENVSFMMRGPPSNTESVCYETPLKVDLLGDGVIDFEYRETIDEWCNIPKYSSCYNTMASEDAYFSMGTPFCQKIWINKTGKVKVDAYIRYWSEKQLEPQGQDIIFYVYETNGVKKGNCTIDGPYNENYDYVGCNIPEEESGSVFYIDKADYYYVCIKINTLAAPAYSIKAESQPEVCGFSGDPPQTTYNFDFAIRAQEAKFAPFTVEAYFNETTTLGATPLLTSIQNYINAKYNANCTGTTGCIIPMKFISLANQQIILENVLFRFKKGGVSFENNLFYTISAIHPKLNMTQQILPLRTLNITAPQQQGNYMIIASITGTSVASGQGNFRVEPVPTVQQIWPSVVVPGEMTLFRVSAFPSPGKTIVSYTWNWGDGSTEQTTIFPNATHTYQTGSYLLNVKATDNTSMQGSLSITITSNITRELMTTIIDNMIARVNTISSQYNALEAWYRDMIGLNLTTINNTLIAYKAQLPSASQSQLATMKQEIDLMKIPLSITDSVRLIESIYYPNLENIEPAYVTDISQETYDENMRVQYQNAIAAWQQENLDLKVGGQVKTLIFEGASEDKFTVVNIRLDPLGSSLSKVYVIFSLPSGTSYSTVRVRQGNYEISNLNDAIGFEFDDLSTSETISIVIPGKHDFSTLNFYASPTLAGLQIGGGGLIPGEEKGAPWGLAIFFIILIILIVAAVLWFLWKGYSSKLEKKLFKNPGDLYNIMSFITNSEAKGAKKEEIIEQLEKSGWSREQINYAWSKLKKQKKAEAKGKPFAAAKPKPGSIEEFGALSPYSKPKYKI